MPPATCGEPTPRKQFAIASLATAQCRWHHAVLAQVHQSGTLLTVKTDLSGAPKLTALVDKCLTHTAFDPGKLAQGH